MHAIFILSFLDYSLLHLPHKTNIPEPPNSLWLITSLPLSASPPTRPPWSPNALPTSTRRKSRTQFVVFSRNRASPEKTLHPNLRTLRDTGLSTSALNKIILSSPTALLRDSAVSRITFWMDFLGAHEPALVKTFMRNRSLINHDITQAIAPKISLLQSQGFSNLEIRRIVSTVPRFITSTTSGMEDSLNRAKELGFQPGSGMFFKALQAMVCVTRDVLRKRMCLFKSFGWSEDDFFSAVRNAPLMVTFKEENLRPKMDFLLGGARCAPLYVASHSMLLTYSLEKRLRPRHHVLHLLETKSLCHKHKVLYSAICMCNNDFVAKYVLPHKELVPELHEAYADLCASGS